jgi:hypothetical protein
VTPRDAETGSQEGSRPVLAVTMTSALAFRNFFQTRVLEHLARDFTVEVLASPAVAETIGRLAAGRPCTVTVCDVGQEPRRWAILRQLKKKLYMEGRASATEAIWEKYQRRPFYQRAGGRALKGIVHAVNAMRLYSLVDRLDLAVNTDTRFTRLLRDKHVSIFLATHATTYEEEVLLRSAAAAGIPRVYMVLSWDHLSSKVVLHENLDAILVWNDHTRDELLATYPAYRADQIHIVGIPQYDQFLEPPSMTYEAWCRQYGLDPSRRTILFSTMPQVRHNQQHVILRDLLEAIVEGKEVPPDFQVLIKCHPFDNFEGYEELVRSGRYPVGLRPTDLPRGAPIEQWTPGERELEDSRDCLVFSDININIFSTVTIEASWFDKPVIHIAYDPLPIAPGRIPCHEYYGLEHFRPIVEKDASMLVGSASELFAAIRQYAAHPEFKAAGRRAVVESYIGDGIGQAAVRVSRALRSLVR